MSGVPHSYGDVLLLVDKIRQQITRSPGLGNGPFSYEALDVIADALFKATQLSGPNSGVAHEVAFEAWATKYDAKEGGFECYTDARNGWEAAIEYMRPSNGEWNLALYRARQATLTCRLTWAQGDSVDQILVEARQQIADAINELWRTDATGTPQEKA